MPKSVPGTFTERSCLAAQPSPPDRLFGVGTASGSHLHSRVTCVLNGN